MNGRILLDRQLLEWEWWGDYPTTILWIYILLNANWKDKNWRGIDVPRGSFITSFDSLSKGTGLSKMQVRTAISKLETTGEITRTVTRKYQLVAVEKYDLYQDIETVGNTQNSTMITGKQHDDNTMITPTEKRNKRNKEIKKDILSSKLDDAEKIISYLNKKTGRSYRADTKQTLRMINARLEDGYTLEDFYKVIDNQVARWSDTDMADYLRPNTLFAPKHFDEYLNAPQTQAEKQDAVVRENIERAKRNIEECKTRIAYLENKINEKSDFSDFEERRALIDKRTGYEQVLKQNERYLREHKGG